MNLPDFEAWAIFAAAARLGSFTAVSHELAISKPTVSKAITRLEESLGTVLFHRTSRKISLSTAGKALLPYAQTIALDGEAAMEAARDTAHLLRGQVRLAAPLSFGLSHLAPVIADFMCAYPEIMVDVQLSDARVDLIEEGFDLAIRIAELPDSSLRAIRLRGMQAYFIASPDYLKRSGTPISPDDLTDHDCFLYSNEATPETWHLKGPKGQKISVRPRCRFQSNNGDIMLPALIAGRGIGYLPDFLCQDAIDSGALEPILPDWRFGEIALNLVMPPSPHRPARVNALINFLKQHLR
ncbi:LysR family transcriptional regulator [Parasphingorhabdus cellanae]|uniref:LysR family transcriptional regulator n=1 Tax=Parasphingorhabdus cellanae TaxID=2806553 RepID=A0ABX7T2F7_9SPHN|nr:LysR family transcriptional regulator [Parasphingorhabdus cellanae]QTD54995.1 LysR family transcriptional regulator [Parasphingorhabdus cellanae]